MPGSRPPSDRCLLGLALRRRPGAGLRHLLHRLDDVVVARTAAEVAIEPVADLLLARLRVARQEVGRRHDHPRRAVAALEAVRGPEGLLQRMEIAVATHAPIV